MPYFFREQFLDLENVGICFCENQIFSLVFFVLYTKRMVAVI
jgi:hypothetical protein